jgi:hypothetical protein
MHPAIIHAIKRRQDFSLDLSAARIEGRSRDLITQDGHAYTTYTVFYDGEKVLYSAGYSTRFNDFVAMHYTVTDEVFASDFMLNRYQRVNAVSDALAEALGL